MASRTPQLQSTNAVTPHHLSQIAVNCPLVLAQTETPEKIRLIILYDSLNQRFQPVVERCRTKDSLGVEIWTRSDSEEEMLSMLEITSICALLMNTIPAPAEMLIQAGDTLVEYIATVMESLNLEEKQVGQMGMFLNRYRDAYQNLKKFREGELVQ